jgi:hypothetical protein
VRPEVFVTYKEVTLGASLLLPWVATFSVLDIFCVRSMQESMTNDVMTLNTY